MKRRHVLLALGLLLAGLPVTMPAQGGGCSDATRTTLPELDPPPAVRATATYSCAALSVKGLWTIHAGGHLILDDVILDFRPGASGAAGILSNGRLTAASSVLRPATGSFTLDASAGSTVAMADTTVAGAGRFAVATGDAVLDRVLVSDAPDVGLVLRAPARLENVTVDGAVVGVRVESGAPALNGLVTTRIAAAGLQAVGGQPTARGCAIAGADSALLLRDAALVSLRQCSLEGPLQARLESSEAGSPRLTLVDTPADPALLVRDAASRVDLRWSVQVRGQPSGGSFSLAGAELTARDASGNGPPAQTLGPTALSPVLVLDGLTLVGPSVDDHNPWRFSVRQGSSLGSIEAEILSSRVADPVVVPVALDDDVDPPAWEAPATALRQTQPAGTPGWSATGAVGLAWEPADDSVGGLHPNRTVDRYEVLQQGPGGGTTLHRTNSTSLALANLPAGGHLFKVRPVDLAGNAGGYTPPLSVFVDRSRPVVTLESNRTPVRSVTEPGMATHYLASPFKAIANGTDVESAPVDLAFRLGVTGPYQSYTGPIPFTQDGSHQVGVRATNQAGAVSFLNRTFTLDRQPPILQVQVLPSLPDGQSGWHRGPIRLTATAEDAGPAGIDNVTYRLGTGAAAAVGPGTLLAFEGQQTLRVNATDRSGNRAESQLVLHRDNVTPALQVSLDGTPGQGGWYISPVTMRIAASDNASGLASVTRQLAGGTAVETALESRITASGVQSYTVRASDRAGNLRERSVNFTIDTDPPVPPHVRFLPDGDGNVEWGWSEGAPLDLVSGLGPVELQRGDADGLVLQSLPVTAGNSSGAAGPFPNGRLFLRMRVTDQAGNSAASPWTPVDVEGGLPVDAAAAPVPARGTAHLTFVPPAGFDVAEVRLLVEGRLHDAVSEPPYAFAVPTADLPDGKAELRFVALSTAGARYEEARFLDVRNGYGDAVVDHPLPFGLAAGASAAAAGLWAAVFVLGRKWVLL